VESGGRRGGHGGNHSGGSANVVGKASVTNIVVFKIFKRIDSLVQRYGDGCACNAQFEPGSANKFSTKAAIQGEADYLVQPIFTLVTAVSIVVKDLFFSGAGQVEPGGVTDKGIKVRVVAIFVAVELLIVCMQRRAKPVKRLHNASFLGLNVANTDEGIITVATSPASAGSARVYERCEIPRIFSAVERSFDLKETMKVLARKAGAIIVCGAKLFGSAILRGRVAGLC
jgi:hypothetical protein